MAKNFGDDEQRANDRSAADHKHDAEKHVGRSPHPDFATVQASRPDWRNNAELEFTKTKDPDWKFGQGGTDGEASLKKNHIEIDPYEAGRPAVFNYKLLISGITPRPIGFLSTRSKDGRFLSSTPIIGGVGKLQITSSDTSTNLAPMSYFNVVNHDPPIFTVGFAGGFSNAKDSLRNLTETRECTINIISEHFVEAANACSINSPYGVSEWALSGLHPASCSEVKCDRVKESVFAIEGKLIETKEFESRTTKGKKTGVLAIIEGIRFWVREDAINEEKNLINPGVLRPMSRLGGITYGRTTECIEIPRPDFEQSARSEETQLLIKPKVEGQ